MIKHTQTICRKQRANCLRVFDHIVGLVLKELKNFYIINFIGFGCYSLVFYGKKGKERMSRNSSIVCI